MAELECTGGYGEQESVARLLPSAGSIQTDGAVDVVSVENGRAVTGELVESRRRFGFFGMVFIGFFWCSGSIYGNETMVEAGPSAYVFIMLALGPIVYALPISLIVGELGTALPLDGGQVEWVQMTCGDFIGGQNAFWTWVSFIVDCAVYPVLAVEYLQDLADLSVFGDESTASPVVAMLFVILVTVIKLSGTNILIQSSGVLFFFAVAPAAIYMIYGVKEFKPVTWGDTNTSAANGGFDPKLLFSWTIWLYSGFISLGSLAGEVHNPSRTYPRIIVVLVVMTAVYDGLPLMVALSMDDNRSLYEVGYFQTSADLLVGGDWLGISFVVGAVAAMLGVYVAEVLVCERSVAAVMEKVLAKGDRKKRLVGRSRILKYLMVENGTGVAPVYILFNAVLVLVLVWLPYEFLIEFSVLQGSLCVMTLCYSFCYFKLFEPDMDRPFKVPCGMKGAVMVCLPLVLCQFVNFYLELSADETVLGIPHGKLVLFVLVTLAGVLGDFATRFCNLHSSPDVDAASDVANDDEDTESDEDIAQDVYVDNETDA